MKNRRKIGRLMGAATAVCAMFFLCIGGCLVYGLRAAKAYIDANCKRDLAVVMEQLERPYITRLNTSFFLTQAMERYLFAQGERVIDLKKEARFLSALDGQSVRDVLFVNLDGRYVSLSGHSGRQEIEADALERLDAGKTVSGYRLWNGEEAFFVVRPILPFIVQNESYDAIAVAYRPETINGQSAFYAYNGRANVCMVDESGRVVYAADDVWNRENLLLRYDTPDEAKSQAAADIKVGHAGCVTLKTGDKRVYLAYRPIQNTPYLIVCEVACALVQNVLMDYTALIARIVAIVVLMLGALTTLLDVSIIRMLNAIHKAEYARENEQAQEKANRELASINQALRESITRTEALRGQFEREQAEKERLLRSVSRGIRTPLNAVLGLTHLMNRTQNMEGLKKYASQIQGQVEKMIAVLNDEKTPMDLTAYADQAQEDAEKRLEGIRVLLAEDGEMNAEIIMRLLTDAGAQCDRAADGLQALRLFEAAQAGTYDVILMDMQMPILDGCDATRAIRRSAKEDAAAIPIVAMTANAFDDVRERIFDAGMDGYLGKPVEPGKLACAVLAAVRGRKND